MFVSNVSHEMRTPLAALTAELDIALQKERSPQQYREAMANALGDAQRMAKLIDGLLNLAKADYRKEDIKMEEIRLDELCLTCANTCCGRIPTIHVELISHRKFDDERQLPSMAIRIC